MSEWVEPGTPGTEQNRAATSMTVARWWTGPVKFGLAVFGVQSLLGGLLVLGYAMRYMERRILNTWYAGAIAGGVSEPQAAERVRPQEMRFGRSVLAAGRRGLAAILCMNALLLPALMMWSLGWWAGWNNSFAKGYEQAAIGPLVNLAGVLWFCACMPYVAMAQARLALTDDWRTFFDFGTNVLLVRSRWLAGVVTALLTGLAGVAMFLIRTAPGFFPQLDVGPHNAAAAETLAFLNAYYLGAGVLFVLVAFAVKRVWAGLYAHAALKLFACAGDHWCSVREQALLSVVQPGVAARQERGLRVPSVVEKAARAAGTTLRWLPISIVWFALAAQLFVGQFLSYHGPQGWLNQPLLQVPVVRSVPPDLQRAARRSE